MIWNTGVRWLRRWLVSRASDGHHQVDQVTGPDRSRPRFVDRHLRCCLCGEGFYFSAGEQEVFARRGYERPRRCKPCLARLRALAGDGARGQHR